MENFHGTRHAPFISTTSTTDHIHEGVAYEISGYGSLGSGISYTFVGTTGTIPVHMHGLSLEVSAGPAVLELIEGPTIITAGTPAVGVNKNRLSTNVATLIPSGGATITGGTVIGTRRILAVGGGAHTEGGDSGFSVEWVLKPSTTYAIRITAEVSLTWTTSFHWFELPLY